MIKTNGGSNAPATFRMKTKSNHHRKGKKYPIHLDRVKTFFEKFFQVDSRSMTMGLVQKD